MKNQPKMGLMGIMGLMSGMTDGRANAVPFVPFEWDGVPQHCPQRMGTRPGWRKDAARRKYRELTRRRRRNGG